MIMDSNIKPTFQSSIDPQKLSLTIESGSKTIIGIITFLLAYKGINSIAIANQLQEIVAVVVTVIPAGFSVWHAALTVYGLVRKMFVLR